MSSLKNKNIALLLYGLITVVLPIVAGVIYVGYLQEYIYEYIARIYFKGKDFAVLADLTMQFGLCLFIVFVGLIIICLNTLIYFCVNKLDNTRFLFLGILSVLIIYGVWIGTEYSDIQHLLKDISSSTEERLRNSQNSVFLEVERIITVTNWMVVAVYLFLLGIDIMQYKRQINETGKDFSKRQLYYVDIPVISGLVVIMIFIFYLKDETLPNANASFHVFSAGANGMQICLSQLIFFIINIDFYRKNRNIAKTSFIEKTQQIRVLILDDTSIHLDKIKDVVHSTYHFLNKVWKIDIDTVNVKLVEQNENFSFDINCIHEIAAKSNKPFDLFLLDIGYFSSINIEKVLQDKYSEDPVNYTSKIWKQCGVLSPDDLVKFGLDHSKKKYRNFKKYFVNHQGSIYGYTFIPSSWEHLFYDVEQCKDMLTQIFPKAKYIEVKGTRKEIFNNIASFEKIKESEYYPYILAKYLEKLIHIEILKYEVNSTPYKD